jgi:TetR/AcrR family transcriptional regulator, regulator of autoinduction and epiphytic fitness
MAYSPPARPDGRNLRAERTRQAIVDATLALLDEGNVQPTAEQIAARAHVSERSVFQHFPDREQLFEAVSARQYERVGKMVRRLSSDGPLEERLDAFVEQRCRVLEATRSVRRAAVLMEPFSEVIASQLRRGRGLYRREVEHVFARELDGRPREDRALLLASLASASDPSGWDNMRTYQAMSVARSREAMRRTVGALLGCF